MIEIIAGVMFTVITFVVLLFVGVIRCQKRYIKYGIIMSRKLFTKSHRRSKRKRMQSPLKSEEYEMKMSTERVDALDVATWMESNDDKSVGSVEDEGEKGLQYSAMESSERQPAHSATTSVPKPAEDDVYFLNISSFCKYSCVGTTFSTHKLYPY